MTIRSTPFMLVAAAALSVCLITPAMAADKIALVVKSLGNGFFDAAHQGALEAAKELKDVEIIYTGPAKATAEGQIEIINSLIAQNVKAIVISANDPDALVPALKKAMSRGIKVISFDSGVKKEGRLMQLNPSNSALIGEKLVKMSEQVAGKTGEIAVLSATAQATNQNIWIAEMKKVLAQPAYSGLKLVSVVYGDDQTDKSYREAQGLFKSHPNLKAIVAPTTVGIAAAAKAVQDEKKVGQIFVTGLGLPSEMAGHVKSGAVKSFAIWNPIDLGYSSIHAVHAFMTGKAKGVAGEKISLGRVGSATLDANLEGAMAEPFTYDASNVEQFAKIF
ncbi:rhamnose ABC transporter substrate-binding protein [Sphaerotilus sp.]|uniref:rhamnose ABC transporter substrate-binding protein n=1 Tax=Sphaerotilus sp. TaxID=2093942 RepID=UPI00286D6A4F|nr:rhamnose ABC transporter substrate-binding protein [Sphaerotilus sp.]